MHIYGIKYAIRPTGSIFALSTENENSDSPEEKSGRSLLSSLPNISRNQKIALGLTAVFSVAAAMAYPHLQHLYFKHVASKTNVTLVPANSNAPKAKAPDGPYDKRNGYTDIDAYSARLAAQGYPLVARASSETPSILGYKIYPPYKEKAQTGLTITADTGELTYQSEFPRQVYANYDSIPPILLQSLFYAENRELLEPHDEDWNPAIECSTAEEGNVVGHIREQSRHPLDPRGRIDGHHAGREIPPFHRRRDELD